MQKVKAVGSFYTSHGGALAFEVMHVLREHAGLTAPGGRTQGRNFPQLGDGRLEGLADGMRRMQHGNLPSQGAA